MKPLGHAMPLPAGPYGMVSLISLQVVTKDPFGLLLEIIFKSTEFCVKKILKWVAIIVVGFFVALMALGFYIQSKRTPEEKAVDEAKAALSRAAAEQDRAEAKLNKQAAGAEEEAKRVEAIPKVTSNEIASAYNENTVAADQRFKGKEFRVSGTVGDINTDAFGHPYVTLRGGVNEFMEPQFSFDKSESGHLAKLKKGDRVTLACKGKGDIAKIAMSDSCKLI